MFLFGLRIMLAAKLNWLSVKLCGRSVKFFTMVFFPDGSAEMFGHRELCLVCVKDYLQSYIKEADIKHLSGEDDEELPENAENTELASEAT